MSDPPLSFDQARRRCKYTHQNADTKGHHQDERRRPVNQERPEIDIYIGWILQREYDGQYCEYERENKSYAHEVAPGRLDRFNRDHII